MHRSIVAPLGFCSQPPAVRCPAVNAVTAAAPVVTVFTSSVTRVRVAGLEVGTAATHAEPFHTNPAVPWMVPVGVGTAGWGLALTWAYAGSPANASSAASRI